MDFWNEIIAALSIGRATEVKKLVEKGLAEGMSANEIIDKGLIAGMEGIAVRFKNNEIFVPEVMLAARAMQAGLTVLKPLLAAAGHESVGRIVIGTVKGDQHDIGKNLVGMMLEGAGFEVFDLGSNVAPDKFIQAIRERKPNILGLSALLTTTMPEMAVLIERLKTEGLRNEVKVMIGGAPVSQSYADQIGADGYAMDAGQAVEVAKGLI
ncbi:MAG TPA: cobalamin-binding protein, partial [Firmicutes bacterium]|nr:cobalamin-binding protein [Bacillota bacterium]